MFYLYSIFSKVSTIFSFSIMLFFDQCRILCSFFVCIRSIVLLFHYTLCELSWSIFACIFDISYNMNCILLLISSINHLIICSMNNPPWYSMIVSICKTHLSFITFILEDEHGLSLGMLMHVKCIDEFCIFSHGFLLHIASYKGIIQCFIVFWG